MTPIFFFFKLVLEMAFIVIAPIIKEKTSLRMKAVDKFNK